MSDSTLLAVIGIAISLMFGAWGVYQTVARKYEGQITFVREQIIGLFDAIVRNLPEMAVLYKNVPVGADVVLVKGALVNTGKKDISPLMVQLPISLHLPQNETWLSASIIGESPNVRASVEISRPNTITFRSGLLRRNEFIRFQALAQLTVSDPLSIDSAKHSLEGRLQESMRFEHRIEDTDPVKNLELSSPRAFSRTLGMYSAILLTGIVLAVGVSIVNAKVGDSNRLAYDFRVTGDTFTPVTIQELQANSVYVKSLDGGFRATLPVAEFFSRCRNHPVVVRDSHSFLIVLGVTMLLYIVLPGFILFLRMKDYRADKKLRRLLGLVDSPPVIPFIMRGMLGLFYRIGSLYLRK